MSGATTGNIVAYSGTLVKTDPAAKQILLHLDELRQIRIREAVEKGYDTEGMDQPFIMLDLDGARGQHLLIKTHELEAVKEQFQDQLEEFTFKQEEAEQTGMNPPKPKRGQMVAGAENEGNGNGNGNANPGPNQASGNEVRSSGRIPRGGGGAMNDGGDEEQDVDEMDVDEDEDGDGDESGGDGEGEAPGSRGSARGRGGRGRGRGGRGRGRGRVG